MIFTKKFDVHSVVHFVGCYALVPTIMELLGVSVGWAGCTVVVLAVGWEALDQANCDNRWKCWFLDPRGGDLLDMLVGFAGTLLAYVVF